MNTGKKRNRKERRDGISLMLQEVQQPPIRSGIRSSFASCRLHKDAEPAHVGYCDSGIQRSSFFRRNFSWNSK